MSRSVPLCPTPAPVCPSPTVCRAPRDLWELLAVKDLEVNVERQVLLVPSVLEETTDLQDPWVCLVLRGPADTLSPGKLAVLDPKETLETRVYRDRRVCLDLREQWDPQDQPESGDLREKKDQPDPEDLQDPWDLLDLQECQETPAHQEILETVDPPVLPVPKETKEKEEILHLRT